MSATLRKLRYRPGMRVAVLGAPSGFEADLASMKDIERARSLEKGLDLIQAFFTRRALLERELTGLKQALAAEGILWICYPKANALGTDLNRDVIRALVEEKGLKTVAMVAVDSVWSALRCKVVE